MRHSSIITFSLLTAACLPAGAPRTTSDTIAASIPLVQVSPPSTEDAWLCANASPDTWYVEQTDSGPLAKPMRPRDDDLRLSAPGGGEFRGYNHGEFGGYLAFRAAGSPVEDSLLEDNPIALLPHGSEVLMVAGLGHLSTRQGQVVLLSRGSANTWTARELVDLRTAPQAAIAVHPDTLLIATSEGVRGVSLKDGQVFDVFRNEQWYLLYATSLARTPGGSLYVGMRRAIAVLEPSGAGYTESWLVPATCPTLRRVDKFSCSCG